MTAPQPTAVSYAPDAPPVITAIRGALNCQASAGGMKISRLPGWTQAQYGEAGWMIADASSKLSGVRLEFETDATWIELELTFTRVSLDWVGLPTRPAVVSLTMADGTEQELSFDEGHILQLEPDFTTKLVPGSRTFARFELPAADEPRSLELWFPPNCSVELHHVRADRDLRPSVPSNPRWIHYGSSISQASEADTPLGVWPVIAARRLELDLLNLGLGGSAHLDQFAARTIRDEPASLITLKLGINVVNGGTLRSRTFTPAVHGFLDTIRDGHPDTPIVVISPILCPTHENAPGPTIFDSNGIAQASDLPRKPNDGQLTLSDIREALAAAVEARSVSDPNLFFLDGTLLFGSDDVTHLPDGLHPDPEGYRLMGERFEAIARTASWLPTSVKASEY